MGLAVVLSALLFVVVLSFLVLIHEAGHFIAARLFGVYVYEFGIGYPPKIMRLFRRWGVDFTLNWLPFGGFVRLAGEERGIEPEDGAGKKLSGKQLLYNQPVVNRIMIILAGAVVNFGFGVAAFGLVFTVLGIPQPVELEQGIMVTEIAAGSPADKAGLQAGDLIEEVRVGSEEMAVESADWFAQRVKDWAGKEVVLELSRNGESKEVGVYVRSEIEIPQGEGAIGIGIADEKVEFVKYPLWQRPFRGAWYGLQTSVEFGWLILRTLVIMANQVVSSATIPKDVAGPIGIVHSASKEKVLEEGLLGVVNFAAILSINLAIVNVLPIPALDGGRALFVMLEKILGKRFKPIYEQYANTFGFVFLVLLVVLISLRDVGNILGDLGVGK